MAWLCRVWCMPWWVSLEGLIMIHYGMRICVGWGWQSEIEVFFFFFLGRLAIIGLTSSYIHSRIPTSHYTSLVSAYKEEVTRFNIPLPSSSTSTDDIDSLFGDAPHESVGVGVRSADDRSIKCEDEFRLMLLRHWTLWESMYHSTYVATRMGVWKEKGVGRLTNLLVKMGYVGLKFIPLFWLMVVNIHFQTPFFDNYPPLLLYWLLLVFC